MLSCLVLWPDSFDYPLFRKNLPELQEKVDEVIICFTKHGNHSLREWIKKNTSGVKFINEEDSSYIEGDWRNKATNYLIDKAKGDWILFLEQDFFIRDYDRFFEKVKQAQKTYGLISFKEADRFHPAFFLIERQILEKITTDFSARGEGQDHFWYVSKQLEDRCDFVDLNILDLHNTIDWIHMGGLTENYFAKKPYYKLDEFYAYNDACTQVETSEYWGKEMLRCQGRFQRNDLERFL